MITVTGGAGFLGSFLVDKLSKDSKIKVVDNLSTGSLRNLENNIKNNKVLFLKKDIENSESSIFKDSEIVYHLAAFPDVREGQNNPEKVFKDINVTLKVLEGCRRFNVKKIVFTSSSTVYGNAKIPTPENHFCDPISNYGLSKLICENLIEYYSKTYGVTSIVLRYANIFGPRSNHGVIFDFYSKLLKNPKMLEILGNGLQNKSYLYVRDCIDATILAANEVGRGCEIFNIGNENQITVNEIARILIKNIKFEDVEIKYTGGELGWPGDISNMFLDISKIKNLGWKPKTSIEKGIKLYLDWLNQNKLKI